MKTLNREDLLKMPISKLRLIDIRTGDEERLIQEILDSKAPAAPAPRAINRSDVPDIKNKEQEDHWQKIIDAREAEAKGVKSEAEVLPDTMPSEAPITEVPTGEPILEPIPEVSPSTTPSTTPSEAILHGCGQCTKMFKTAPALKSHISRYHKVSDGSPDTNN